MRKIALTLTAALLTLASEAQVSHTFDIDLKIVLDHISIPLLFLTLNLLVYCTQSVIYYITYL